MGFIGKSYGKTLGKLIAVLIIVAMATGQVFSEESTVKPQNKKNRFSFSIGGGGIFTMDFTNHDGVDAVTGASLFSQWDHTLTGGGINMFFDATYAEANVGLLFGENNYDDQNESHSEGAVRIGLLGKYPFPLGSKWVVFPLLGVDGVIAFMAKRNADDVYENNSDLSDALNQFWFKFGVGTDYYVTDTIFLRGEFLYGQRLYTAREQKSLDAHDELSILGHGLDVKLLLGYRF
jgi:hypothetical protein